MHCILSSRELIVWNNLLVLYYAPAPLGWGMIYWWLLPVCLSVCPVPEPNSRTEWRRKQKIGRKEVRNSDTGDPWYHLEIETSNTRQSGKFLSLHFNGHFPGEPEAKDDGSGGDNRSYKMCKAPVKSSPPTLNLLQARCPSCRPANSVQALKLLVYNKHVHVQQTISVLWPPGWRLSVAVQVTTCRGRHGGIVSPHCRPHSLFWNVDLFLLIQF